MSDYQAPLRDMRFVIHELIGAAPIREPGGQDAVKLPQHRRGDADAIAPL